VEVQWFGTSRGVSARFPIASRELLIFKFFPIGMGYNPKPEQNIYLMYDKAWVKTGEARIP
jgi:hypothetical protein